LRILITGTPAVGKTLISFKLACYLKYDFINLNSLIFFNNLFFLNKNSGDFILKVAEVRTLLESIFKQSQNLIIDTHIISCIPRDIDYVFILRCDPLILYNRLSYRKYFRGKILENIESEFIGVISNECYEYFKGTSAKVFEINATYDSVTAFKKICRILKNNLTGDKIDWVSKYSKKTNLLKFIKTRYKLIK